MPASDEVQSKSSSRAKKGTKTPLKRLTKLRKTSTTGTRSLAARASSNNIPVINIESDPE